ncbi:allophanate hydrolase [Ectothiorhodosinus mongolicus]|uniref:Allophanate hydrolase n=1 Tax=Ectothiorhodosinus mongolicus TaxID=233100 RepID=A0A1R3W7Q6_9GAMM|nr:allophanate hydrolase [Ectothiorhodosinus mongolicus]ULX57573.1 allophanate hydrolase [Ectothiorhodosinus mongolicus]SIT72886.1 allophanate hydrolase [Ectothiorhodosinus mongolicus]
MNEPRTKPISISQLREGYRSGRITPRQFILSCVARIRETQGNPIWIRILSDEELIPYLDQLESRGQEDLPLYGIPFAIKDNIDLAGIPTTVACPEFAYTPTESAFVVEQLIAAGAIPMGKTNLDQFATGLVGTRSPFGACANPFNAEFIAGGSSSGSAVAVAFGMVSFALGTDTAGSGRVPAALNNIIGYKPTRGLLSNRGVVPACRSLDTISIFALNIDDARLVHQCAAQWDSQDSYSRLPAHRTPWEPPLGDRFTFGVPPRHQWQFFDDNGCDALFEQSIAALESLGGEAVELDLSPFFAAAKLLYDGPWIAERYLAIQSFIESRPEALLPVTRDIINQGKHYSALDVFHAQYELEDLRRHSASVFTELDFVLTPTIGGAVRLSEVYENPIQQNDRLGQYNNFANLLDLCAVTVPVGFNSHGLSFGVNLFSSALRDGQVLQVADGLHRLLAKRFGVGYEACWEAPQARVDSSAWVRVIVCGAHMSGLPLNAQLTERGGRLERKTKTAAQYKLYVIKGRDLDRPGLLQVAEGGCSISVEVWNLPISCFGSFVAQIKKPLGIGSVALDDGSVYPGFLCESYATEGSQEISHLGGWREYLSFTNDAKGCLLD